MNARGKSPYTGKLAEPLPDKTADSILSVPSNRAWKLEVSERIGLLFDHYGISDDKTAGTAWMKLAVALLSEHVPGFQRAELTKRGRPKTRNSPERRHLRAQLLRDVEKKKSENPKLSDSAILRHMKNNWDKENKNHPFIDMAESTIRAELREAREDRDHRNQIADVFRI